MNKLPLWVLLTASLVLIGHALTLPVAQHKGSFFSDEATYYAMAYSLAFDGDMRYEPHDLERVYDRGYTGGPSGIFLRQQELTGRLYYAKAFAYSLAAAPFVRVFGDNGFYLLHALLLSGVMLAGYAYLARSLEARLAAAYAVAYFLGSIAALYYFWLTPEIFNLAIGFFATFLWLYKERPPGWPEDAPWQPTGWLAGGWTDVAAAVLYGVAAYSKPPNVILFAPMLAWLLIQRRVGRMLVVGAVCAAVIVGLFAVTHANTGDWNYMGGDRKSFVGPYPFQYRNQTFDTIDTGTPMVTNVDEYSTRIPRADHLAADLLAYLWVGRNAGLLIYMLPAVLAILAWAACRQRRWASPYTLLIGGTALTALAYMTVIQANWIGGGGAIGSRYFVSLYYAPFFVIPAGVGILIPAVSWTVWAVFLSQIVLNPWASSHAPGRHTQNLPFTLLPAEFGMLTDLPFNTDPFHRRITLNPEDEERFDVFFLDDNTWLREPGMHGFWVKSRARAEIVMRVFVPVETVAIELTNGPVGNTITATLDGQARTVELDPSETTEVGLSPASGFTFGDGRILRLVIDSRSGGVPMMYSDDNEDFRHMGVFVRLRIVEPGD